MNEDQQASALAAWLTSGGEPPEGVDPDVLEAVYALRPELAPAPRLTVDDILDGLAEGPFAAESADAALPDNVVAFPGRRTAPAAEPSVAAPTGDVPGEVVPLRTRWWMGGAAGALAAAAAALLVLSPARQPERAAEQAAPVAAAPAPAAPAAAPAGAPAAPMPEKAEAPVPAAAPMARPAPAPSGAPGMVASSPAGGGRAASGEMIGGATLDAATRGPSGAPPAGDMPDAVAVADEAEERLREEEPPPPPAPKARAAEDLDAYAAPAATAAAPAKKDRAEVQQKAAYDEGAAVNTAPAEMASDLDIARELAAQGDYLAAARRAEPLVRAPAASGQLAALEGARWALAAGDPPRAIRLAEKGLALGASGPYADALRAVLAQAKDRAK